jgi:hypothetical protein
MWIRIRIRNNAWNFETNLFNFHHRSHWRKEQDLDPDPIIKCTDSRRQMLFNISVLWIPDNLVRIWIRTFRIRIKIRIRFQIWILRIRIHNTDLAGCTKKLGGGGKRPRPRSSQAGREKQPR